MTIGLRSTETILAMSTKIRNAVKEDIKKVFDIATSRALDKNTLVGAKNSGFLVSSYSEKDYYNLFQRADFFLIAEKAAETIGFLIAYSPKAFNKNEWLNYTVAKSYNYNCLVIKQVATIYGVKGVGTALYRSIIESTAVPLFAAIVAEPENLASIALHTKTGFQSIALLKPNDGILRNVWATKEPITPLPSMTEQAATKS